MNFLASYKNEEMNLTLRCDFLLSSFLQATVGGLHPTQPAVIRICAVRAVSGFCEHLKQSHKTQMLIPHLPNILDGLVAIAQQFSADVLALAMETLAVVLTVCFLAENFQLKELLCFPKS